MFDSLTRREFMESAALGGAALITPVAMSSASMQRTSAAPRAIKKSLKYPMVRTEGTIREKFKLLREIGFHGVELDSPSNLDRDEVLRAKDETCLAIPGVIDSKHWSKPFSHPDPNVRAEGRRALEIALHDAKAYGATTVLLVPAVVNKEVSYDDAYERSQIEIRKVLPLAEDLGVKIAIENVWNNFLLSPLEASR